MDEREDNLENGKFTERKDGNFERDRNQENDQENNMETLRYSQNFLWDKKLVASLVERSSVQPTDLVIEIGPGNGIITEALAERAGRVIGVEKDPKLASKLQDKFGDTDKVEIINNDFLTYRLPERGDYKVISNIPFTITAGVISKLINHPNPPQDSYLVMQEEAAQKYSGSPCGKERMTSLLLKINFEPEIVHNFKRSDFKPRPSVEAVFLRLERREKPLVKDEHIAEYRDFIAFGFIQWKPSISEAFRPVFTKKQMGRLARDLNFDLRAKPTELNFDQWLALFDFYRTGVDPSKKRVVMGAFKRLQKQQRGLDKIHRSIRRRGE